jgi:hypothetical protein
MCGSFLFEKCRKIDFIQTVNLIPKLSANKTLRRFTLVKLNSYNDDKAFRILRFLKISENKGASIGKLFLGWRAVGNRHCYAVPLPALFSGG